MTKTHRFGAALILLLYLALGLTYGLIVPPFENLDEVEHFEVVRYITDMGRLPVHGDPNAETYHYRQEASQPPLYHLLSAGLVRLLGLKMGDVPSFRRLNPWVSCGPNATSLYANRAVLYHDPNREAFPWRGALLTLHLLRCWSTLLQAVTVVGAYLLGRLAFPRRPAVALLGMAVVAFNPQFLLVASGINNDNLVTPLVTLGLCLLLRIGQAGPSARRVVGLGLLGGLAGLTKLSGWLLAALAVGVILLLALRRSPGGPSLRSRLLSAAGRLTLLLLVALAVGSWWFWRNWQLYGDPTALRPMLALVGPQTVRFHPFLAAGMMFKSFWGQISCSFYPASFYAFYTALLALALVGLPWGWRRLSGTEKWTAAGLAAWVLLVVVSWARWDALTPAPGGRLLFPALPAVGLLTALGIGGLGGGRWRAASRIAVALLALVAWWTAAGILPAFYGPPPRYADAGARPPAHPLDVAFGEAIRLRGYDLAWDGRSALDLTLYWQAAAASPTDYVLALQLVSPVPGDETLRWNENTWPGHGNYPVSAWRVGETIADRYRVRLPAADFPTQAWNLQAAFFEEETGARLPVQVGGVAVGDRLVLTQLRVPGRTPDCPEEGRLLVEARFGDAVALTHALVAPGPDGSEVVLCWKSLRALPGDATVFVHLYDSAGVLIGAGDGPPAQGAFPTSQWRPGDVVRDVHRLATVEGGRVTVGLYYLADDSRLPASIAGEPLPDAEVEVWP